MLLCFAWSWEVEAFVDFGTPVPKKSYHYSPMRPNEFWTHPDTEPPGLDLGCQRRELLGPFEEEEAGIGIANDVVKVEGEVPPPQGCLREDRVRRYVSDFQSWVCTPLPCSLRNPKTVTIPQYWFNKTKQHTASGKREP